MILPQHSVHSMVGFLEEAIPSSILFSSILSMYMCTKESRVKKYLRLYTARYSYKTINRL